MSAREPERWVDAEGVDEALRTDLERAAGHDVGYDVEAGLARFEATLGGGPPSGGDGGMGGAGATSGSTGLTLVVGAVLAIGAGAVAWSLLDRDAPAETALVGSIPTEPPPSLDSSESAPAPVADDEPTDEEPLETPPSVPADVGGDEIPEIEPARLPAAKAAAGAKRSGSSPGSNGGARPTKGARPSNVRPEDDDRLRREMKATDRARQALPGDPAQALRLARQADRDFPGGLFSEDREGISILALFGLGRDEQARRRAAAFLRAHPRSSYADRIRAAMAGDEEP